MLATDVVTVSLRNGARRNLPDLRAATDDDDSLSEDGLKGLLLRHFPNHGKRLQVRDQGRGGVGQIDLQIRLPFFDDVDRGNVAVMAGDHAGQLVQDSWSGFGLDQDADLYAHL